MKKMFCRCLTLLILASTACRCARLPINRRLRANETPILIEETTTPAPPVTELGTPSTIPEINTNKPASVCTYNQKTYSVNEQFSPDPCTSCWCKEGNNTECVMMSCMECISGPLIYIEGQCCPECQSTPTPTNPPTEPTPTISTSCQENGKLYFDGEEYYRDVCTPCTCVRGQGVCAMMSCRYCEGDLVYVAGQCCPDCLKITTTPCTPMDNTCLYEGEIYVLGEEFSPDQCTFCRCEEGGEPMCVQKDCAQCYGLSIPNPDHCCPDCIRYTTLGEEFYPDSCTFCRCEEGGNPVCTVVDCALCQGPGQCCPYCRPSSFATIEDVPLQTIEPEYNSK